MRILKGMRLFKYIDYEHIFEVRVVHVSNENKFSAKIVKSQDELELGKKITITIDQIDKEYTLLSPDGYISFNIVTINDSAKDVMVLISRTKDIKEKEQFPFAVCRQCASDLFTKQIKGMAEYEVAGISISKNTCPENVPFKNYFMCNSIDKGETIAYYIGDKLEDTLEYLKKIEDYDYVLDKLNEKHCMFLSSNNKFIAQKYRMEKEVDGYCKTLKDLLYLNNFEYDLYSAFDIIPFDIHPEELSKGYLTDYARLLLSDALCENITKTIAVKYDKDIDLSKIGRRYCLITDNTKEVYLVAYITEGKYNPNIANVESAENIRKISSLLPSETVQNVMNHIMFNTHKYDKLKQS